MASDDFIASRKKIAEISSTASTSVEEMRSPTANNFLANAFNTKKKTKYRR